MCIIHVGFVFMVPPIGLKNLGATCYLNVLMQCLFHNLLFRDIVMDMDVSINDSDANIAAEDDLTMKRIVGSFQSAFAHMQLYHNTAYDLLDFTGKCGFVNIFHFSMKCLSVLWFSAFLLHTWN